MSNNTTPKRIDLDDLSVLVHHARNYQEYLEEENRRIAQLEEEKDTRVIELADELEERDKDPRIEAWNEIADHPFFEGAYDTEDTLLGAMLARLDAAMEPAQPTVPRVITADELKPGQWVAWESPRGGWVAGLFEEADMRDLDRFKGRTIVLLEDTPAEEPGSVKVGDTISSDARAAELPEGTILLDDDADPWRKGKCGHWRAVDRGSDERVYRTAEPVRYTDGPLTVLHLPEEDA